MVQLWTGDGVSWDAHDDITGKGYKSHTGEALRVDRPIAGLIRDLAQRGLLDSTLVMITTEFGRTPFAQADKGKLEPGPRPPPAGLHQRPGRRGAQEGLRLRRHRRRRLRLGAGPGDDLRPARHRAAPAGIDHERLTFYHDGIRRRLTNVHGKVVKAILA